MGTNIYIAVLRTISYFHVFRYPITRYEIWRFLPVRCTEDEVNEAIDALVQVQVVFALGDYYSIVNDTALAIRRIKGNALGKKKLKKALVISRFLGLFPFVEAVCVSGSLSKDFALHDSDLDYFVVTAPNRLWVARNLMHLFRKVTFLVKAQKSFCMNYFVSMQQPEIQPKNYYTAIELATLKTGFATTSMKNFIEANSWVTAFLPNIALSEYMNIRTRGKWLPARLLEFIVNKAAGDRIEDTFYRTTIKRWAKKWTRLGHDVNACMRSAGRHVNTPINYPIHYPDKILNEHEAIFNVVVIAYNNKLQSSPNPLTTTSREPPGK